jgi:1-deoxy-D-xylulose-5-phosphate synthase
MEEHMKTFEGRYPTLARIRGPRDLRELNERELHVLADELRDYIVSVVSRNGGHLAPNLGVVELTIALHYVFESPADSLVWDVSHQAYAHKILTGRARLFETLRKGGGISGFTSRLESEHDAFTTGHASTSLAYAAGLAEALKREGRTSHVVAIIGDGALTGGVAFEALNNIGHQKLPVIIVLNDNEMSIAKNVGAISSYLSRVRLDPAYNRLREEVERTLKRLPGLGQAAYSIGVTLRESIKAMVIPGMIFEELGLRYFGPIDGHNLERLVKALSWAKTLKEPIVLHVTTKKGKGYLPAEEHPEKFHGSSPFVIETGEPVTKGSRPSYTQVFGEELARIAHEDERILAITAAMPSGTGLDAFAREHPDRFFDVGIAEQYAVTFAAGLAAGGFKPVCAIYSTFLARAYDQVIQDVCLQNLPVVFAIDRAGLVGEDGPTHHGAFDLTYLRAVPNITIVAPASARELSMAVRLALSSGKPFAIRYPRGECPAVEAREFDAPLEIGRGVLVGDASGDVCFVAVGKPVFEALAAAETLRKEGIRASVFNARFVKPFDEETLETLGRNFRLIVTVEDNVVAGGFGEAVASMYARAGIEVACENVGLPDRFVPHGSLGELYRLVGLDSEHLARVARERLSESGNAGENEKNGREKQTARIQQAIKKALGGFFGSL